jgi:hypothetical protein
VKSSKISCTDPQTQTPNPKPQTLIPTPYQSSEYKDLEDELKAAQKKGETEAIESAAARLAEQREKPNGEGFGYPKP